MTPPARRTSVASITASEFVTGIVLTEHDYPHFFFHCHMYCTLDDIFVRMYAQWSHLKPEAIRMRKRGASLRDVSKKLGIAPSTLSHWFRNVPLSAYHKKLLKKRADKSLISARKSAVVWHNAQKTKRLEVAREEALRTLGQLRLQSDPIIELALAILYLGEGSKKSDMTSMGNSDARILRFFVEALHRLYHIPRTDMRCELHLRDDQNISTAIQYWSRELQIPSKNFSRPSVDKRTRGRPTYPHYKGVCIVRCSRVAIQRKLMYIATTFCDTVADGMRA